MRMCRILAFFSCLIERQFSVTASSFRCAILLQLGILFHTQYVIR
jgi:hypothetical protein